MASSKPNPLRRARPEGAPVSFGTLLFAAGRLGDVALQYYLLKDGGQVVGDLLGVPATLGSVHVGTFIGLYSVTALRQAYWALVTNKADMPTGVAVFIILLDTVFKAAASVTAVC